MTNFEIRKFIRQGSHSTNTARLAPGYQQANIAIVPSSVADRFHKYCLANPEPCPLLAVTESGETAIDSLAFGLDIRTDLPAYEHYYQGKYTKLTNIKEIWRADYVTFALGCSFTFDFALESAGIEVRHKTQKCNVPMYISSIQTKPVDMFSGPTVVSMRPVPKESLNHVVSISRNYPHAHGAPVHIGDGALIGISDIDEPDFGDAVNVQNHETTVFWACGVTPRLALERAGLDEFIVHSPGCMLITDRRSEKV